MDGNFFHVGKTNKENAIRTTDLLISEGFKMMVDFFESLSIGNRI